ncbi:MAG: carbamate kinase [Thermodesulfobacteriota bacterium]
MKKDKRSGKKSIILSIGGNVIIRQNERGTIEEQFKNIRASFECIVRLIEDSRSLVITHGNGPIVGNILIRNELAKNTIPPMPLYVCDADSEGGIGFMLQQTLYNEFKKLKKPVKAVTVVTQTVVSKLDPAFKNPSKPVGPYYAKDEAKRIAKAKGFVMAEDSGRGWRRLVPSPKPIKIIESGIIKELASNGVVVIAVGGGGIPVVENPDKTITGIDAVVDKDLATALLAKDLGTEIFINLTQIDRAYLNFGKPWQKGIDKMTVKEAKKYLKAGEFLSGSMGPKIEAAIEFLDSGGEEVIITSPESLKDALEGKAGTRITKN